MNNHSTSPRHRQDFFSRAEHIAVRTAILILLISGLLRVVINDLEWMRDLVSPAVTHADDEHADDKPGHKHTNDKQTDDKPH